MANISPLLLNNVSGAVQAGSSAIGSASATGVNVASGEGAAFGTIGTNQYIPAVIVDTSTTPETVREYVYITARSTDALTVVRQAEESSRYAASTTTIQAGYVIAAVASGQALYGNITQAGVLPVPRANGYLSSNYFLTLAASGTGITSGTINLIKVPVPTTMLIGNVSVRFTTAGATLTSGQCLAGLYDASGSRLAQSADQSANWTSTGLKTTALTAPVTVVGGPDVVVYAAILSVGTNAGGLMYYNPGGFLDQNQNLTAGNYTVMTFAGNTSLPSSLTLSSGTKGNNWFWAALS